MTTTAFFSDKGPRAANEDAVAVLKQDGRCLLAVADGLGGYLGGATASAFAVDQISQAFASSCDFRSVAFEIHKAILETQRTREELRNMATTLTAVCIDGGHMTGVHIGDTRCAVQRGSGIRKITEEHTEARRLFKAGRLTKSEFENYPRRNVLDNALGSSRDLYVDEIDFQLESGDKIVLTSDGVHELVKLREMSVLIQDSILTPDAIVSRIRSEVETRGPQDNFSIVVAVV